MRRHVRVTVTFVWSFAQFAASQGSRGKGFFFVFYFGQNVFYHVCVFAFGLHTTTLIIWRWCRTNFLFLKESDSCGVHDDPSGQRGGGGVGRTSGRPTLSRGARVFPRGAPGVAATSGGRARGAAPGCARHPGTTPGSAIPR